MAVRVVKAYDATSDLVFVTFERNVDLPTDGKPTREMRASPDLLTSKPDPPPLPAPGAGSSNCARRRASLLGLLESWRVNVFERRTLLINPSGILLKLLIEIIGE